MLAFGVQPAVAVVPAGEAALGADERGRRREPEAQQDPLQLTRAAGGAQHDEDAAGLGGQHRVPGRLADLVVAVQQGPVHVDRHRQHPRRGGVGRDRVVRAGGHRYPPGRDAGFSQTDTWLVLSLVNGSRAQPLQRSRSVIPASRAIRSSSAGHT